MLYTYDTVKREAYFRQRVCANRWARAAAVFRAWWWFTVIPDACLMLTHEQDVRHEIGTVRAEWTAGGSIFVEDLVVNVWFASELASEGLE